MTRSSGSWDRFSDNNLSDYLDMHSAVMIQRMVKRLPIPNPKPTRKAEGIAAIVDQLTGAYLQTLWSSLGRIGQLAVREALYDPVRKLDPERFRAKYGVLPPQPAKNSRLPLPPFEFFLHLESRYTRSPTVMPEDLGERLRKFVHPPPDAKLAVEEKLPESVIRRLRGYVPKGEKPKFHEVQLVRRDMERTASRDLSMVLRLVELGKVAVSTRTLRPSAVTVRRITEELDGGDFFGPDDRKYYVGQGIGSVRAFAWPLLLQAGRLVEIHGSKLALTKAGRAAFGAPPAETLRHLWQRWINHGILDEFSRIDTISGQRRGKGRSAMAAVSGRRPVVAEALERCPVNQWVRFDQFARFMRADGYEFEVTHDPWKLYIGDSRYGSLGYGGSHDWGILQGRYILCLLFEYAATLGLIDIAYTHPDNARLDFTALDSDHSMHFLSRYDGLEYFQLNALGAYCLGISEKYEPASLPDRTPLKAFPDLRLCADSPMSPEERLTLEMYANAESDGVWRLNQVKTLVAIENGHDVDGLRAFLCERDDQPLPEKVEGFLRSVGRGGKALKEQGRALLVECNSEEIAAQLATDKRVSKMCLPVGKKHLAVHTKSEAAFRKAILELGFGMPRI